MFNGNKIYSRNGKSISEYVQRCVVYSNFLSTEQRNNYLEQTKKEIYETLEEICEKDGK